MCRGVGTDLIERPQNERVVVLEDNVPVDDFDRRWSDLTRMVVARTTDIRGSHKPALNGSYCRIEDADAKAGIVDEGGPMLCCRESPPISPRGGDAVQFS